VPKSSIPVGWQVVGGGKGEREDKTGGSAKHQMVRVGNQSSSPWLAHSTNIGIVGAGGDLLRDNGDKLRGEICPIQFHSKINCTVRCGAICLRIAMAYRVHCAALQHRAFIRRGGSRSKTHRTYLCSIITLIRTIKQCMNFKAIKKIKVRILKIFNGEWGHRTKNGFDGL
jgi:hypothetical protein